MDKPTSQKRCSKCQKFLPATSEYFSRDNSKLDGLFSRCKPCARKVNPLLADSRPNMTKVTRGYKTELDLNNEQITLCKKHAGAARFAYNWGLARSQEQYQATGKRPSAMDLHKELNARKQTDVPWMYEVSKCAPQSALEDLEQAFKHFFRCYRLKQEGK